MSFLSDEYVARSFDFGEEMQKEQWPEEKPDFMVFAEMDVNGLDELVEFEDFEIS